MKQCPACGYQDTPTERQMLYQYRKAFGDMPVMAMMKRGWLRGCGFSDERGWSTVPEVRAALEQFFGEEWPEVEMKLLTHSNAQPSADE